MRNDALEMWYKNNAAEKHLIFVLSKSEQKRAH